MKLTAKTYYKMVIELVESLNQKFTTNEIENIDFNKYSEDVRQCLKVYRSERLLEKTSNDAIAMSLIRNCEFKDLLFTQMAFCIKFEILKK